MHDHGVNVKKIFATVTALVLAVTITQPGRAAEVEVGLGGSPGLSPGSIFPFIAYEESSVELAFMVQNTGDLDAELGLSESPHPGIELLPTAEALLVLKPGELAQYPYQVVVRDFVPPGDYRVVATVKQTNVPQNAQVTYAPGIAASFVVSVVNASAEVTVVAINSNDRSPVAVEGVINLYYQPEGYARTLIATERGNALTKRVVPGPYFAQFEIPDVIKEGKEFRIAEDEFLTVEIPVRAVQFVTTVANFKAVDGNPQGAVDLGVAIKNSLDDIEGPVDLRTRVTFNGELFEEFNFASLAVLPSGTTEQRTTYVPDGGLQPGEWAFTFILQTPKFSITSTKPEVLVVDESFDWIWIAIGLAGLAILIWWWLIIAKRRKRRKEKEESRRARA